MQTHKQEDAYRAFLARKLRSVESNGFNVSATDMHDGLFEFQRDLTAWALRRGRAAIFAATGLGKTRMEIEWARHVVDRTKGKVLVLAPLSVAPQTVREGEKISIPVKHCRDGAEVESGITITNYERLHRFDPDAFTGIVLDESSCIKHQGSKTLAALLEAFARTPYRLSATATPAPNDYTELGTQAEFLGICTRTEMLSEYFVHDGGETQTWRLKGHARKDYWNWVASWAALVRGPSDLGYPDDAYQLPELTVHQHILQADQDEVFAIGRLFAAEAGDLRERREARRATMSRRVTACVNQICSDMEQWVVWCDLNAEQDALEKAFGREAVSIRGNTPLEEREILHEQWLSGKARILISKGSIFGFGLNWQHCARMAFVGVTDSWEMYHQCVRRIWRFGQQRPVDVHLFASEAEGSVVTNLERKERDAQRMADELSVETRESVRLSVLGRSGKADPYTPSVSLEIPSWIGGVK